MYTNILHSLKTVITVQWVSCTVKTTYFVIRIDYWQTFRYIISCFFRHTFFVYLSRLLCYMLDD